MQKFNLALVAYATCITASATAYEPKWPRFSWDTVRARALHPAQVFRLAQVQRRCGL
eukprot:COSAG02_NODE_877_length_16272_cov_8.002288_3_plen_57_part_00